MPVDDDAMMELARLAHRFWCCRMQRDGWKYGDRYDPKQRTHDALRPFDHLTQHDQRRARALMELEKDRLAMALDYPRGADRPFSLDEMRKGLRVAWAPHVRLPGGDAAGQTGEIESWEQDESGLTLLRVRWAGGDLTEHEPEEGDVVRLDPP